MTVRTWVAPTNPDAERVINKVISKDKSLGEHFHASARGSGKIVSFQRDSDLADTERVPLNKCEHPRQGVLDYFDAEVLPHSADAWINATKLDARDGEIGVGGYETNFNRYF